MVSASNIAFMNLLGDPNHTKTIITVYPNSQKNLDAVAMCHGKETILQRDPF